MIAHPHVTGVILAGGRATRMGGADKGAMDLGAVPGDTPLRRTMDLFAGRFPECVIVGARGGEPSTHAGISIRFVTDRLPGCGPLGGIHAALGVVTTLLAFVCACDMPSLSGPLIDLMVRRALPGHLLVPVRDGRPEPLHAIYPASCLPAIEQALAAGTRRMAEFFESTPVDYLPEADYASIAGAARSFDNINTPEDLERFLS